MKKTWKKKEKKGKNEQKEKKNEQTKKVRKKEKKKITLWKKKEKMDNFGLIAQNEQNETIYSNFRTLCFFH